MYGIYANIWGILMVNVTIYGSTMDPMGLEGDNLWIAMSFNVLLLLLARLIVRRDDAAQDSGRSTGREDSVRHGFNSVDRQYVWVDEKQQRNSMK